jgi:hypothetical protein
MSMALSSMVILISPDLNIGMVILCTHSLHVGHRRHQVEPNTSRRADIVAQLIGGFRGDDHNCNQWLHAAYNDSPSTQFLTQICAEHERMNSQLGCRSRQL